MKITKDNYFKHIERIGFEKLPEALKQAHLVIMTKTDNGRDWKRFESDSEFNSVKELAFKKLGEFILHRGKLDGKGNDSPAVIQARQDAMMYVYMDLEQLERIYQMEKWAEEEDGLTPEIKIRKSALEKQIRLIKKGLSGKKEEYDAIKEIQFIERFLAFRDKMIRKNTIKMFIDDLQKAILEKKIRKHSPYAKQVARLQEVAIRFYNKSDQVNRLVLSEELLNDLYSAILDYENKISKPEKNDPIDPVELSGVEKIEPEKEKEEKHLLCSTDFAQLEFKKLGFTGKWLDLIGDPSPGFTAMVFGKPKMGKSYLCVDFAGYLARNFGKVLYVAKEEKLDATLQQKLKDKEVAHENLFVSDHLPEDLSTYDFIFLDSVNLLQLNPESLRNLRNKYSDKGFIYIFQTTKAGNFRGANSFQHDVDVVIEVPEKGKATQFGRFNQGGEINIFEDAIPQASEELNGTGKNKKKEKYPAWTTPKHLGAGDHYALKRIYDLYKKGELKEAYNYAFDVDTIVREEIPGDIWKKIGGTLTKTGEEKLKAQKLKAAPEKVEKKKTGIVFTYGVRLLKEMYENYSERKLTDADYIEILDIAETRNRNFDKLVPEIHRNLMEFLATMNEAIKEWDEKRV